MSKIAGELNAEMMNGRETIESLRQQFAAANSEIARRVTLDEMNAEIESATKAVADFYEKQLAAIQLQNTQLREAVELAVKCFEGVSVNRKPIYQALDLPTDTTTLEAMIVKAGEVMRERCLKEVCSHVVQPDEIRALPGVTLEDLND